MICLYNSQECDELNGEWRAAVQLARAKIRTYELECKCVIGEGHLSEKSKIRFVGRLSGLRDARNIIEEILE